MGKLECVLEEAATGPRKGAYQTEHGPIASGAQAQDKAMDNNPKV